MDEIRVLTGFNETGYNNEIRDINSALKAIQPVVDKLNSINAYRLDQAALLDLIFSHGEMVANGVENTTRLELEKAGISSSVLKKTIMKEELEAVWRVINEFKDKRSLFIGFPRWIKNIKIEDGRVFVPDDIIESEVKEYFCSYIRTEAGLQKKKEYDALVEAAAKFLEGNRTIGSSNLSSIIVRDNKTGKIRGRTDMSFDNMCQDIHGWYR